ncbi:class I SAM-dependent methyltransferase [Actinoplanes aureus]|uniref:Class I SAM-dependent methyltransferase n=1 Tax=Actinoplanes aureus TaxID=2792083 RepID=A0A931G3G8_9ACTN|nr:class I SAM-dependent methyltransferase [Actinoplanes aureus]MBG0564254.1 class I SAM-dependent methyltransferase [Actinoplanes aureus]
MDWVPGFYSRTGSWWGPAEARITERDHRRVRLLGEHAGAGPHRVLELGCGYGTTAAATARAGHSVTAVEITDRVGFADSFSRDVAPGSLTLVNEDFYRVRLPERFGAVTYWNGFGVGSDADQRRLLRRIAAEWLLPDGVALIDVFNPFVWARWDGDETHRTPDPARGYAYELFEVTTFDPVTCTAVDTWWEAGRPDEKISQVLRCYSPADLTLLLEGTGLRLTAVTVGEESFAPATMRPGWAELLREHPEYVAVLRRQ